MIVSVRFPVAVTMVLGVLLLIPSGRAEAPDEIPEAPAAVEEYAAEPTEVLDALSAVLAARELVLESGPEGEWVTEYAAFTREDFGPDVAEPPLDLSRTYPFFQPEKLGTGRYRIRAKVEPVDSGSRLTLEADLLARGFNRMTYEHLDVKRTSNGVIEAYFHERVGAQLKKAPSAQD